MSLRSASRGRHENLRPSALGMPAPGTPGLRMPGLPTAAPLPGLVPAPRMPVAREVRIPAPSTAARLDTSRPLALVGHPRQSQRPPVPDRLIGADGTERVREVAADEDEARIDPLRRATRAWLAIQVSPVLSTFAFLARGLEQGAPPRGAGCAQHLLGPLLGVVVGPVSGPLPLDATEQMYPRAAHARGVDVGQWREWLAARRSALLLEDLTALLHGGSCAEGPSQLACTCVASGLRGHPMHRRLRPMPGGLGNVPALTPDPSGQVDPWHDALVEFAGRFRGRGTEPRSRFSSEGGPTVHERRQLLGHLTLLANTFAGPRRVDRMAGLGQVPWSPGIRITRNWQLRDRAAGTEPGRDALLDQLARAVWP